MDGRGNREYGEVLVGISFPHLVEGPESRPEEIDPEVINHFNRPVR
jgi:hypothetical protein